MQSICSLSVDKIHIFGNSIPEDANISKTTAQYYLNIYKWQYLEIGKINLCATFRYIGLNEWRRIDVLVECSSSLYFSYYLCFSFLCLQADGNYKVVLTNRCMEMKLLPKEIWAARFTINQAEVTQSSPAAPPVTCFLLPVCVWSRGVGGWWMSPSHRPVPAPHPHLPPGSPFIRLPPCFRLRPLIVTVSCSLSLCSFFLLGNR